MTLIWPWPDPAVEPQQRATPTHVTFSTQVWVPQVFCDLKPMFHNTPIDHFCIDFRVGRGYDIRGNGGYKSGVSPFQAT